MKLSLFLTCIFIAGNCFADDIQSFKSEYYKLTNQYVATQTERNQIIAMPEGNTAKEIKKRSDKLKKLDCKGWKTNIELNHLIGKALDTYANSPNKPEELASYSKDLIFSDLEFLNEEFSNPENGCQ